MQISEDSYVSTEVSEDQGVDFPMPRCERVQQQLLLVNRTVTVPPPPTTQPPPEDELPPEEHVRRNQRAREMYRRRMQMLLEELDDISRCEIQEHQMIFAAMEQLQKLALRKKTCQRRLGELVGAENHDLEYF